MKYVLMAGMLYLFFFLVCYINTGTDQKNMRSFYAYPKEVQKLIHNDPVLRQWIPKKPSFLINMLLFVIVFICVGKILSMKTWLSSFLYFLILGEGLNLFDLFVIDALWWRNSKRIRFKSIQNPSMYKDMTNHIAAFKRAVPVFVLSAVLAALVSAL